MPPPPPTLPPPPSLPLPPPPHAQVSVAQVLAASGAPLYPVKPPQSAYTIFLKHMLSKGVVTAVNDGSGSHLSLIASKW